MIYIYDILLNFNKNIYEYYEWNREDEIFHIKRIRLFKIDSNSLDDLFKYNIKVDANLLKSIFKKTDLYRKNSLEYCAMFTDGYRVIAIVFNKNGNSILKSRLVLDEEEEILDISKKMDYYDFNYERMENSSRELLTRKDEFIKQKLLEYFKKLYKNKNISVLKYLYLDYFNDYIDDVDIVYNSLIDSLLDINDKHKNMLNILELSKNNKSKLNKIS